MGIFEWLANSLDFALNIIELSAILISIGTVLFFTFNKYSKALKYVLTPCGLTFFNKVKVLFLCRKSFVKKRAFIEFATLKTQGYMTSKSEWKTIINEFKAFYDENPTNLIYMLPNCTPLIDENFSETVSRYFKYLSDENVKKLYGIRDNKLEWVIQIHIEEAYTTPTCLLSGLLAKYEENWEEFIKSFVSTAYMSESSNKNQRSVLSDELYLTFAWLLWGPSFELEYKNYWAGLCQISYGDESNSIPVVINNDTDAIEKLQDKFKANEERRYGALLSVDVTLYEKKAYFEGIQRNINPSNAYFYDKVQNNESSFAVQINDFDPCMSYKAKKYYCTAYVWLLFELEDENDATFRPEASLAFFEHANLADKYTYTFLIETLIDKAFKHFKDIFADKTLDGRKYRFVCAFNDAIATRLTERFEEELQKGGEFAKQLGERIFLEPKRSASVAFAAYDEFFSQRNEIDFEEVSLADKATVSDLAKFYTEIYMECFPNTDERETFDNLLDYLKLGEESKEYEYHITLAKDVDGNILAGGIFNYYKRTNSGVIEFLAVKPSMQSSGIGSMVYSHINSILTNDSNTNGYKQLKAIFCEIDSPEVSQDSIKKYLYFWNKNHYKHLDFHYLQPALSEKQEPVTGLWLSVVKLEGDLTSCDSALVLNVVYDYMKYSMKIANPETNSEFIEMKEELSKRDSVKLLEIIST